MTAAQHLQRIISAHLDNGTRSTVAAFLGLHKQQWGRYLHKQQSPSEAKINAWLALCIAAGIDIPATVGAALSTPTPTPTQPETTMIG